MITLRPYQEEYIRLTRKEFNSNFKHLLVAAPTGAGKTVIFSKISKGVTEKNNKVLILTNRTELLSQSRGSLSKIGIKTFNIIAGTDYVSKDYSVYVAMAQTLRRRIDKKYWIDFLNSIDLLIIDECHIQDFNFIFESKLFDNKFILGFTATPTRSGKMRQLGLDYEKIIETVTVKDLIALDYLNDCDYFGCNIPDLSNVGFDKMKGDYQEKQMFNAFNQAKLYAGVVRNWIKICPNTKTLVFCCNIEHAIRTCQEFNDNGIKAKFLTSEVSKPQYPKIVNDGTLAIYEEKKEAYELYCRSFISMSGNREKIIEEFENAVFSVLINASILTTGFDCPSIETIIVNRATMSLSLWLQMLGRGSRVYGSKTHFNILDFGDNQSRLGTYSQDRNWSLWHEESKGGGLAPIKLCGFDAKEKPIYGQNSPKRSDIFNKEKLDGCKRYIHAGLTICPFCGFKYPVKVLKDVDLEMIAFSQQEMEFKRFKPISQMNDKELADYCKQKGHKTAWLWRQLYMRGGTQLIDKQEWSEKTKESAKKYCKNIASYI